MPVLGVIPARFASTRFPGKPLADIAGKSMIRRVAEQCAQCVRLNKVIVATDDERIARHVRDFGGEVQMTSSEHQSGTDRCAEVARQYPEYDIIINIQGDEPYIDPEQISTLIGCFDFPHTQLATLVKKVGTTAELLDPGLPKVMLNKMQEAIYFSRSPLPHVRGQQPERWLEHFLYYRHIGIYGYRAAVLEEITRLPVSALERAESLEQLRWIENGFRIRVAETALESYAVDTPEDLRRLLLLKTGPGNGF